MVGVGRASCHHLTGLSMRVVNRINKTVVRISPLRCKQSLTPAIAGGLQPSAEGNSNWFDFLSGSGSSQGNPLGAASLFPTARPSIPHISGVARSTGGFAMPVSVSVPQSQTSSPGTGHKRAREDDAVSVHSMHSLHSGSGKGDRQRSESVGRRSVSVDKPLS